MKVKKENKNYYTADFETLVLTDEEIKQGKRTYVWAWALCSVSDPSNVKYGTDIKTFFECIATLKSGSVVYFHNLKFDGNFIMSYLLENKFNQVYTNKKMPEKSFTSLVSNIGVWYSIDIKYKKKHIIINDSYKKLPFSVAKLAKDLGYEELKGEIDYTQYREEGGILSDEDKDYIRRDVQIVAKALKDVSFGYNMYRSTIASDCMQYYKSIQPMFDTFFPVLKKEIHNYCANAYGGGWCYYREETAGQMLTGGIGYTLDWNSMHPSQMHSQSKNYYPYKIPVFYKGEYKENKQYPLYIQRFKASFKLKPGHVPSIQIKGSALFKEREFLKETEEPVELTLTSVDLDLFFEQYDVYTYEPLDGYMFKACIGAFDNYINYWYKYKEECTKKGDKVGRMVAKLALNSFYGKFGTDLNASKQDFKLNDEGVLTHTITPSEKEGVYLPVAAFVTAYSRRTIIHAVQANYDHWYYSDTDSMKLYFKEGEEVVFNGVDLHPTKLGYCDVEDEWNEAVFLRQKTYACHIKGEWKYKAAGMNDEVKRNITDISQFHINAVIDGKKMTKHVKGGVVIRSTTFKILDI